MTASRGEIWMADLNPVRGHEQAGFRPCLIVSVDLFNHGPAELLVVLPITSKDKHIPFHIPIEPQQSGLDVRSYIKCEDIRSISKNRLAEHMGQVPPGVMELVEDRLRILLQV
ncbi:MAG: growth inhibitor PemK [Firmicutes bacterium ML8_F2]|jgi:mRNA interferase MazF|nr:MAG: growth inhibitor PemK [Firmicutes bacterium ML8_F2]